MSTEPFGAPVMTESATAPTEIAGALDELRKRVEALERHVGAIDAGVRRALARISQGMQEK